MYYNDYYNYGSTAAQNVTGLASLAVGVLVLLGFLALIVVAAVVVQFIATMKIFKKAGRPGWAAFVPGYSDVLTCEMVGIDPRWVLIIIYGSLICAIPIIGALAFAVAAIYYAILVNVSLARAFGKSDSFAVGLILLPVVFYAILGFGSAKYGKINPMNDVIFKKKAN